MSKKKEMIQGTKTQKILLAIQLISLIIILICILFSKPLGLSEEMVQNITKYGLIIAVILGLVTSMISGEKEDAKGDGESWHSLTKTKYRI